MTFSRRKIGKNILFLLTGQTLSWVFASVEVILIPSYLGPTNLGIFSVIASISSIIGIVALLGTNIFIQREVARDPKVARHLSLTAVFLCVGVGVIGWSLALIIITFFDVSETIRIVFYILAISNLCGLSTAPLRSALQGMDKMHFSLVDIIFGKGLGILLAIVVIVFNLGLVIWLASTLFFTIPVTIFFWRIFLKNTEKSNLKIRQTYKVVFKGGMAFFLLDVSSTIYTYLDALLLAAFTSETVVGYYGVGFRLLGSLMIAPVVIGQALLPTLSRLALHQPEDAKAISYKTVSFIACISLPIAIGASIIAEPFISLFYGGQFAPSAPVFAILAWNAVPTFIGIALFQILVSQNKQGKWAKLTIISIIVNLILNVILINFFQNSFSNGAIGASISLLITEILVSSCGLYLVGRDIVDGRLALDFLKSLIAALGMGIVVWLLRNYFLPIPIIVGILVYGIAALILFDFTPVAKRFFSVARQEFKRSLKLR